jgi:cell division protein ZapA
MAQVTITINGRNYPVACNAGEEGRIGELARYVDGKVKAFAKEIGAVGEARLLLLTALVLADELAEARELQNGHDGAGNGNGAALVAENLAGGIDDIAQRIETIAMRLETSHI